MGCRLLVWLKKMSLERGHHNVPLHGGTAFYLIVSFGGPMLTPIQGLALENGTEKKMAIHDKAQDAMNAPGPTQHDARYTAGVSDSLRIARNNYTRLCVSCFFF